MPRIANPPGAGEAPDKGAPLHRNRALALGGVLSAVIFVSPALAVPVRERGVALGVPESPARRQGLAPGRRPDPAPAPAAIRIALADSLLVPPLPEGLIFGATWVDLDGDGDLDLTIPVDRPDPPSLLIYRNDRGVFHDIAADLGLGELTLARSAVWLDLDGDGDLDLYVTRNSDADGNRLYRNDKGRLVQISGPTPADEPGSDVAQAWGDFDGDGDPDLYLGGVLLTRSRLFRNDGDFQFRDVTVEAGLDTSAQSVTAVWTDFDNDGDLDLTLGDAFDFRLFVNQGDGRFVEAVLPLVAPSALLVNPSWADVDGDGDLDVLIGGMFPSFVLENRFDAALPPTQWFANRTGTWGAGPPRGSGGNWVDLDLDGDPDLLADSGSDGARLFENQVPAGGRLVDLSAALGLGPVPGITWHPVPGDIDGDGRVDFFAPHETEPHLWANTSIPGGRPLRLHLVPRTGGVALGARVLFTNEGRTQLREIQWPVSGFSYASPDPVLSVAGRPKPLAVDVRWTSGAWERFRNLHVDKLEKLVEGKGRAIPASAAGTPDIDPEAASVAPALVSSCNPCREQASFAPTSGGAAPGRIRIYDALGRLVRDLGEGAAAWDLRDAGGRRVAPGIYWARGVESVRPARLVVLP